MKQRYFFTRLILAGAFLGLSLQVDAQNAQEKEKIRSSYDLQKLENLRSTFAEKNKAEKAEALRLAQINGWKEKIVLSDGRFLELQKVVNGKPIYYSTIKCGTSSKFQLITKPFASRFATSFPYKCSHKYNAASNDFAPPADVINLSSWTNKTSS